MNKNERLVDILKWTVNLPVIDTAVWLREKGRTCGLPTGSKFPEGTTLVYYEAKDSYNRLAICRFDIRVKVLRCASVPAAHHRWHSCSKSNIAGSRCEFYCSTGYKLVGSSLPSLCRHSDLKWSLAFPTCQVVIVLQFFFASHSTVKTCSPLPPFPNGNIACSDSNRYNSVCTYDCNSGFGFTPGDILTRTCRETWSGSTPTCIDVQHPVFLSCPRPIPKEADDALTSAEVCWQAPKADDNVPSGLTVTQILGLPPCSRFSQGTHTIKYQARDAQGNTADCVFSVTVRVITCSGLEPKVGLIIDCPSGHIKGASCTFQCDVGYRRLGGNSATCLSSGSWSSPQPTCEILRCQKLDPPAHGDFRDSRPCGDTFGSWCYFDCDVGYSITGSPARLCVAERGGTGAFWDGTVTECQPDTCQVPQPGPGLLPNQPDQCPAGTEVVYNTVCRYKCSEGYSLQGGSSMICGEDGQWKQTLPQCTEITCASSDLPAPVNGVKSGCSREREPYGTACTLSCNRGYTPTTSTQRTCQSDSNDKGVWSGGTITCTVVTCPLLPSPTNGFKSSCVRYGKNVTTGGLQPFDTTCTSACNEGYTIFGTATRNCLVSGTWDGSSVECRDVTAPVVQCPVDQIIFAGEGQSMVSVSWHWEPVRATDAGREITAVLQSINSAPVTGPKPSTLEEGTYSLVYSAADSAGNSGSCSMQLETKVTRCTGLNAPLNGALRLASGHGSCTEGAVYGSICEISCDAGYTLSTEGATLRRQCNRLTDQSSQGYWTLEQPTCEANTCPYISVTNGYISGCGGDTATYGDLCQFHCDLGHRSTSGERNRDRQCQADGSWSGPDFQCTVTVTCPGAFSLPHGLVNPAACRQNALLPYDTVCRFSCGDGFLQQGPAVKTCSDSGDWDNPQSTQCLDEQPPSFDVSCPQSVTVKSDFGLTSKIVTFDEPTATDNSGRVNVSRQVGHLAPGSRFPEGKTTVTYTATDPTALSSQCDVIVTVIVHRCKRLQAPNSGSIRCDHPSPIVGTKCSLECNTGYTLSGSQHRTCQLTSDDTPYWDGDTTACTIVRCPAQSAPPHSIKSGCSLPSEPYGTECSFYCENGYEAHSSDGGRSRCLADGTWSGTDLICNETECPILSPSAGIILTPDVCYGQPIFGHNCLLSCTQDGFAIEPPGSEYMTCLSSGKWSQNISDIQCVDHQNPLFTSCPFVKVVYVDKGSTSAQVNLSISAVDNDRVTPTVTCNPGSGLFEIGKHKISCVAMDTAGNSATCSFVMEVNERKCPVLSPPFFGEFVGECHRVYGSVCHWGCIDGYRLVGSSEAICEFNGNFTYWQQDASSCELISCEALSLPYTVQVSPPVCTSGNPSAGDQCHFFCLNDFTLVGGVPSKSCNKQGVWEGGIGDLPTNCEDQIAPVVTCPSDIRASLEDAEGVSVTFDIPTARDNDPLGNLTLMTSPADIDSPYIFNESTQVVYIFTDVANNSATCAFLVQIFDEREPIVVFCPTFGYNITTKTSLTEVTWEEPIFEDPSGDELEISNNRGSGNTAVFPWGTHAVVYTATDSSNGKTAICEFLVEIRPAGCSRLNIPDNGGLACDEWNYGHLCTMFCNKDYDIPRLSSSQRPPKQYVCGLSGFWRPHSFVPDCSETRRPGRANLPCELMYFTGDCNSQETKDSIAAAFIELLKSSTFKDACDSTDECTIGNVRVTCGATDSGRRRRSLAAANAQETYGIRRQRHPWSAERETAKWNQMQSQFNKMEGNLPRRQPRKTTEWEALISFEFSVPVPHAGDSFNATLEAENVMIKIAEGFISDLEDGTLPPLNVPGLTTVLKDNSMTYGYAEILCEPGYVANNEDYVCSACSSGFLYDNSTSECRFCPRGYYQTEQAQFSCDQCPPGTTTVVEGANNKTWCEEACLAGNFSSNGIVPCFKCMLGEYQPLPGQTSCVACPNGTTTQDYGAQSLNQCLEICSPGNVSDTGLAPCRPCDRRTYQPLPQQRHCILCPGNTTTLTSGATSVDDCQDINECDSSPCEHQATCVDLIDSYRCDCPPGFQGVHCDEDIDDCADHRCVNGATCVDGITDYHCQCSNGYEGKFCEINIDECASLPCKHEGVCYDEVNSYRCQCTSNYHGVHCELEVNSCSPTPCLNGATCHGFGSGYQCECAPGYSGDHCTLDINECSSNPCQNGAVCQDMPNSYNCICAAGYEGTHCENDVDWCAESPCHDGSTCMDLGSTFRCVCPLDRVGDLCDTAKTPCHSAPCVNDATCAVNADDPDLYTCHCVAGYTGLHCEKDYNECASQPCSNGGTCIDELSAFMCKCPPGFEGETCSSDINECSSNPCGDGNFCEDDVNGYICMCRPGLTGPHCEDYINYCKPSACQHGSTCSNTGAGYQCTCADGFAGINCEVNIDECASGPCQHGGYCMDHVNGYACECQAGFTGTFCHINIDDCTQDACQNNATCIDGVSDFTCICLDGFTGTHCEGPVDYCQSDPCQHSGICQNNPPGYSCFCLPGFGGCNCEENFDECSSFPCVHASSCVDGVNNYTCTCNGGYDGINCEHEIDECASSPCLYGGTCLDLVAGFVCNCIEGRSGDKCDLEVDRCQEHPCLNAGTCRDEIIGFTCVCADGYTGELCETDIDECGSVPCQHGGECEDQLNAYVCHCSPGFKGTNCDMEINECQELNVECQHGGTCIDKVANFECLCSPGYGGRYCLDEINECNSDPCQNGATCVDEEAAFSCHCPTGFAGPLCEVLMDLCLDIPCSNGATCSPMPGGFTCTCPAGYSGELCDLDVDECSSQPCLHQASCVDEVNGYQCACLPGFMGDQCETELPSDFDLHFSNLSAGANLIQTSGLTCHNLEALSTVLWVRSKRCHGDFILLKLSTLSGTAVKLSNPSELTLNILGHETTLRDSPNLCDGMWHSVLLTWHALDDSQEWKLYIDLSAVFSGSYSESSSVTIPAGLKLTLGHETGLNDPSGASELTLSGVSIWSKSWSEAEVPDIASSCRPLSPADVFAWSEIMIIPSPGITQTLRAPSECDDFDECSSNPCEAGTCEDRLETFVCHCPEGLEGDRCQTSTDYCLPYSCLNSATCYSENLAYTCVCPEGYNGTHCELEVVDGGWSPWPPFNDCTKTCGGGIQVRSRSCDNPRPFNGGQPCPGEAHQTRECNTAKCPACITLRKPYRGELDCNETADGEKFCKISCREGYAFDRETLEVYRCGPRSQYSWNHQTENNPYARFPQCVKCVPNDDRGQNVFFYLPSRDCDSQSAKANIRKMIAESTAIKQQNCVVKQTCNSVIWVGNCNHGSGRVARQAATVVEVVVLFSSNETTNNDTAGAEEAVGSVVDLIHSGEFTVTIDGEAVHPDSQSVVKNAWTWCPEGAVPTESRTCVTCGEGTFYTMSPDLVDYECRPCPANTYQDQVGQQICIMCPYGMVTNGWGAIDISECYEPCGAGEYRVRSDIIGDNRCEPCPLNWYNPGDGLDYCVACPDGLVTNKTGATHETDCYEPPIPTIDTSAVPAMTTVQSTLSHKPLDPYTFPVVVVSVTTVLAILLVSTVAIVCFIKLKSKAKVGPNPSQGDEELPTNAFEMKPTVKPEDPFGYDISDNMQVKHRVVGDVVPSSDPPPYETSA
ncbi:sushi, von Willebrand factor type A, EGF and pentraxin domain-containing protein 1-like [Acanthaster planci]|uniref:Sushi, von Willebrand factor type A, EGF and pentraxin domain-containing protein 1-like n=1 Tax=Acanthaster planci TaxID=133434 RepID=A0A8B7ZDF8_ACAPL|nr:sushi, von Willebrand factor type A, EGF and pentraxin domain-containing protein 1-like [Acanthaster planci]